jgi:SOS response regulatory protein OraA/RecX
VPDRHIESALESVFSEGDESALLRARVARRRKSLRGPLNQRQYASLYNNLMRAGFPPDAIRSELHHLRSEVAAGRADVDGAPDADLDTDLDAS